MTSSAVVLVPPHELIGPPHAPVVIALGGISATRHVASHDGDAAPGWWEGIAGSGCAIDTTRYRVLGIDFLDGGVAAGGRPAGIVTTFDQADAIAAVLDTLDIERVHTFIGASYGGMVALAFAARYPHRLGALVAMSAAHEPHPMTTAIRSVQRQIVQLALDGGHVRTGLSLARQLAMTTYRSRREFGERFDSAPDLVTTADARFPVEAYLSHHGEQFAARWEPARFLALSLSADLHRVDPADITVPTLLVAAEDDAVVPRTQVDVLAAALGGRARVAELATTTGHDAFLTERAQVCALLTAVLHPTELP